MPLNAKQIKKLADKLMGDRSQAVPPRMSGTPVIRNLMTDKMFNKGRTKMMGPDDFMQMMHEHMRKYPDRYSSASATKPKSKKSGA